MYKPSKRIAGLILLTCILMLFPTGYGAQEKAPITSLDQLSQPGIRIAVGLNTPQMISLAHDYPEAEVIPYADRFAAYTEVANGRVDACVHSRSEMEFAIDNGVSGVRLLDENYESNQIIVGISRVSAIPDLEEKVNAFIAELRADGTLDDMFNRWVNLKEDTLPEFPLPDKSSPTLRVGTTGTVMPYSYYKGTELVGYDIELARRFANWLGFGLELRVYDFGGILSAAEVGEIDCIMSNLYYMPEADESIACSDVLFNVDMTAMVRDTGTTAPAAATGVITSVDQLSDEYIGSSTGTTFDDLVRRCLPDARFKYFDTYSDMVVALQSGKIAAFACDEPVLKALMAENSQVTMLPEYLDTFEFGFIFGKNEAGDRLRQQMNDFLKEMRESGKLSELIENWVDGNMNEAEMPDIDALSGENGTLVMATVALNPPFSFMRGNDFAGLDIDLAIRFCDKYNYGLTIEDMRFDAILPALQTAKADFGGACITITEERAQSVSFSEPYYSGGTVLAVLKNPAASNADIAAFNGKRAGIVTGSFHDKVIMEEFPDSPIGQYNALPDLTAALKSGKVDYFLSTAEMAASLVASNEELTFLELPVRTLEIGAMFPKTEKGDALRAQMDAFITKLKAEGTLDAIYSYWSDPANQGNAVDTSDLTGENGTLTFATAGTLVPNTFVAKGALAGIDPDIAVRFCREYGYAIDASVVDISGIIPGIDTGMYDFSLSNMVITDERSESVNFSLPYHETRLLLVTRKDLLAPADSTDVGSTGFMQNLSDSFHKTFIREGRWRLFIYGVTMTVLITLLSILFGTALGFGVFMLCRNGNPIANQVTRFCLWLVQGMPMVVLLMILYYVVFGNVSISGMLVAVLGFTLTFGAVVFGLLKMGVGTVDAGQYEAAYALGYSNRRTFFRIILPQALPHVLPAYRGEIVGLIKATAIVGYIAVQDLTKMGDIVRSRTYEAFFPLIAVSVIYFVLEGAFGFLVGRVTRNINPRRRSRGQILKGIRTDDVK